MGISEIYIVKRDGKRAPFSVEKIKRAISKAFLSVGGYATDDDLTSVLSRVRVSDGMSVEEIQNQVEVALMASRVDSKTGKYTGKNCWGPEKPIRLKDQMGIVSCDNFYSDSYSDQPLAEIADKAWIVEKDGRITDWIFR